MSRTHLKQNLGLIRLYSFKQSLQKLLNTCNIKNYLHWQKIAAYLHSHLTKLLLTSYNMNYPRKNPIYLKQFYTSLSNQIKFENLKSSLPLKKFSFHLLTSLNLRKLKMRSHLKKRISCILPILISTTTNLLHVYYINIISSETLEKIKISL